MVDLENSEFSSQEILVTSLNLHLADGLRGSRGSRGFPLKTASTVLGTNVFNTNDSNNDLRELFFFFIVVVPCTSTTVYNLIVIWLFTQGVLPYTSRIGM